ncbi:MAG: endonuclease NucS domain-containing protein [Candidatus Heimdallarchaeota archaeon]
MRNYILYVTPTISSKEIKQIENLLEGIRIKHKISYKIVDGSCLNQEEKEDIAETIRRISNKEKIRVRSGGGGILPISRSGAVNLGNIPILLVLENEKPIYVFPHEAGAKGQRFEVIQHLDALLKADHLDELRVGKGLSEQDISKMISDYPALIEKGLEFLDTEVAVKGAQIDAVFKDRTNKHVLVEIERKVTDAAIGQVIKFLDPYSQQFGISPKNIRRALVCIDISENRINTCKAEGIEVYKFTVLKLA